MSINTYPSEEELAEAIRLRHISALYNKIISLRNQFAKLRDWGNFEPCHFQNISVQIELYSWDLEKLDPKFFNDNLAPLPAL